jgi:hypothetical protein
MRLVTRADFDGLVCGALITKFERIDEYLFVEPKFMQDGQVGIREGDIIANLPYHPNCALWFDHHITNIPAWAQYSGIARSKLGVGCREAANRESRCHHHPRERRLPPRAQRGACGMRVLHRDGRDGRP